MNSSLKFCLLMSILSLIRSHTHDEISKCSLTGVYKTRQTIIESPNYPDNYKPNTCWDYVIRSPYKCPTTFHIQFLDFFLEFSKDCKKDYLAIGLENIDDDMDVLCGQVVGIKKYHTPDGVLRLRFFVDESPWTTAKGFKLLVTRLACERDDFLRHPKEKNGDDTDADHDEDDDDTIGVEAPTRNLQPPGSELMQIFRNLTGQEQYQIVPLAPVFGLNYPTQLPSPPYPVREKHNEFQGYLPGYSNNNIQNNLQPPCLNSNSQSEPMPSISNFYGALKGNVLASYPLTLQGNVQANPLPSYIGSNNINQVRQQPNANGGFLPPTRDQYIGSWSSAPSLLRAYDNALESLEACCVSSFQQKHFYLSSPGFPRTIFSNILPNPQKRDCVFHIQKSSANVCRLRLEFKFFDFGQSNQGTGAYLGNIGTPTIENTQNVCREDYIEIDNQRFCGCRSGYMFTAYWATANNKKLRMRMGYSGIPSGGFLLEFIQEECTETDVAFMTTERPVTATLSTFNPNRINTPLANPQQAQQILLGQQQQKQYGSPYPAQTPNTDFYLSNYPYNDPTSQSLSNAPGVLPTYFQSNPFLAHQQPHLQSLQNNNLYPSQFGTSHLSYLRPQNLQHNLLQQQALSTNPFALPQIRYARSYTDQQQPVTVIETNSTRKEYYYSENDSLNSNEDSSFMSRSNTLDSSSKWDRKDINVKENNVLISTNARERKKCTFDMGDILRLSVDILWITKPICYAPQRNWFTNWIG